MHHQLFESLLVVALRKDYMRMIIVLRENRWMAGLRATRSLISNQGAEEQCLIAACKSHKPASGEQSTTRKIGGLRLHAACFGLERALINL